MSGTTTTTAAQHHEESRADRRQQRELAAARMAGQVAPAIDAVSGQMINPHNPEFITKRPWYLGTQDGGNNATATAAATSESLQHQADQRLNEKQELSLSAAEQLLEKQRQKHKEQAAKGQYSQGQWVEALKKNKMPYRICQIIKIHDKGGEPLFDLQFEDGTIEKKIKSSSKNKQQQQARIRMTASGNRSMWTDTASTAAANKEGDDTTATVDYKETFASKRDQYHGYDRDKHNAILSQKYEQKLAMRRQLREKQQAERKLQQQLQQQQQGGTDKATGGGGGGSDSDYDDSDVEGNGGGGNGNDSNEESDDEFVQRDEDARVLTTRLARQGGVGGAQMKVTARNLRIREDTAKYLRNLDPNSAYYDPKSRSMRDNPHSFLADGVETDFAGDNFARISGDAVSLAQQQLFAWDAMEQGVTEVHPQANPSQAELLKKQFQSQAQDVRLQAKRAVLDKYGGAEYLDGADGLASVVEPKLDGDNNTISAKNTAAAAASERKLRFGVTTETEQYSRDGRLIHGGGEKPSSKRKALESKYEENVFINGHSTVWGSYFHKGAFAWGYLDDHSLMKQSYCTGQNGRLANDEANEMTYGTGQAGSAALAQARGMLKPKAANATTATTATAAMAPNRSKLYGEANPNVVLDERKVQEALAKQQQGEVDAVDQKRKYHSMNADVEMTEEIMEAYRLKKDKTSDPMASIGSDELLDYKTQNC